MSKKNIGTVIVDEDNSPNPEQFSFVLTKTEEEFQLQKGMYVVVPTEDGEVLASVSELYKTNRYFSSPSAVRAYQTSGKTLASIFPADRWEYIIAKAKPLGIITEIGIQRLLFPVSPGENVSIPDNDTLIEFLGLEKDNGLNIGMIEQHDLTVKLNLTRFLQKHAAILAISGAGKSYTVSVLLEELLSRKAEQGRVAIVLFDVHGEYKGFGDDKSPFRKYVNVFPGGLVQFATSSMSARQFAIYEPQITTAQIRDLSKVLSKFYHEKIKQGERYIISDIIEELENNEKMNPRSKEALIGWLYTLDGTRLFGAAENPDLKSILKPGKITIFDLSDFTSIKLKQMMVSYILFRIFDMRKKKEVPPTTVILEESHQFCLSEDTEILTVQGWKEYSDISIGDIIYTFNKEKEMYEEEPIKDIMIRDYDGMLIELYNNNCIDSLVTPDHRVFCKTRTTDLNRQFKWSDYRFVSGNELPTAFKIPVTAQIDRKEELKIDDDLLRILGWIITDGSKHEFRKHNSYAYEIYQSKKKNVEIMSEVILRRFPRTTINSRLRKEGSIDGIKFKRKKEYTFYFGTDKSKEIEIWLKDKTHRIPRKILEKASIRQLNILLESLIEGDGTVQYSKNKFKYVTYYAGKNPELANEVQEICVLLGLSAIISKVKQNDQYKVLISYKRKWANVKKAKEKMYKGKVWDITVDNETFIARRKGKSFNTGKDIPEQ